ncbi:MAG TPA: TonB-dependent receptor plug domain-containing protein, partial [Flavitalea sp.]|nr:TonB-dependent receptor plug domain-containing protein [Flavitalea sp.]
MFFFEDNQRRSTFIKSAVANTQSVKNNFLRVLLKTGLILLLISPLPIQMFGGLTKTYQDVDKVDIILEMKNQSIIEVFRQIEKKTAFTFMYRNQDVAHIKNITITAQRHTVGSLLKLIFLNTNLQYKQIDNRILIIDKSRANLKPISALSVPGIEEIVVRGNVTDGQGKPLVGVSVKLKNGQAGTATDSEGRFIIRVPENGVLVFTYIGYRVNEIEVDSKTNMTVNMVEEFSSLNQVVVTGYSTQSKRDITGSVVSIDADELNKVSSANVAQQLQGRSPGVTVTANNAPGGEPTVRIRGFGTINNNEPLYVIDGVPTKGGLNNINPNNIESMQILKDASAASIYGSRAANGVIIITTKKGKAGESKLTFDARYGIQTSNSADKIDVIIDPLSFANLRWTSLRNAKQLTNGNPVDAQFGNGVNPVIPDYLLAGTRYGLFEGDPAANPNLYNFSAENMYQITKANKAGTNWFDEIIESAAP